jgi:hypothetical protein
MKMRLRDLCLASSTALLLNLGAMGPVTAEEPTPTTSQAAAQADPREFDRDGKHICGYDLMTDSERSGHRSQLHFTKSMEDRDAIRKDLCDRMRVRAQERGVPFKE